jgi:hypothetical protein
MAFIRSTAARIPRRTFSGVFHDYVRGVFAEHSVRKRALREGRTRWLNGFAQRPVLNGR